MPQRQQPHRAGPDQQQRVEVGLAAQPAPVQARARRAVRRRRCQAADHRAGRDRPAAVDRRQHRLVRRTGRAVVDHHDPATGDGARERDRAGQRGAHRLRRGSPAGPPRGGRRPSRRPAGRSRVPRRAPGAAATARRAPAPPRQRRRRTTTGRPARARAAGPGRRHGRRASWREAAAGRPAAEAAPRRPVEKPSRPEPRPAGDGRDARPSRTDRHRRIGGGAPDVAYPDRSNPCGLTSHAR